MLSIVLPDLAMVGSRTWLLVYQVKVGKLKSSASTARNEPFKAIGLDCLQRISAASVQICTALQLRCRMRPHITLSLKRKAALKKFSTKKG